MELFKLTNREIDHLSFKEFRKKFPNELSCLTALLGYRLEPDRKCINPSCGASVEYFYTKLKNKKAFQCRRCYQRVYPMMGTIFDHSHIELIDWFQIVFQLLESRNGASANLIARHYDYWYPTALRALHSIRELMSKALEFDLENTVVEIDESYIKTGTYGYGPRYYFGKGRGTENTTSILAIVERRGRAKLFVVPTTEAESLIPRITDNVSQNTIIYTDSWGAYHRLTKLGYQHTMVNHSLEFVNGSAGTNAAENIFTNIKRMVRGTYRNVSEGKLQNYLNESAFRHSYRLEYDYGFEELMKCLPPLSQSYSNKIKNLKLENYEKNNLKIIGS